MTMVPAGNKAQTPYVEQPFRKNNSSSSSSSSSSSIHDRNLRAFPIEMYKIYHNISPTIMNKIFTLRHQDQYNLRKWTDFDVLTIRTVNHGSERVIYLVRKTWEVIAIHKNYIPLTNLKSLLKIGKQNLVHVSYTLFLISHIFISNASSNWQKIKQKLSNTLRLNFCYLKIIHFLHPCYCLKLI